jgi:TRAP-type C4-dicarboxylate transport system substrate-binding protein
MKTFRKLIGSLVLLFLFLSICSPSSAAPAAEPQAPKMKLRFASLYAEVSIYSRAFRFWTEKVAEKTNGRITWEIYYSAQLLGPGELIDGARKGVAHAAGGMWIIEPGRVPLGSFETNVPFNEPNPAIQTKIKKQMFDEIPALNEELAKWNLGPAIYFVPNTPYDLLTKKPVKTLADLKGMRIGHTPVEMVPIFQEAGAVSVISAAAEYYSRLERGVIDGICLNFIVMGIYKHQEVAKYYTTINLNTPVVVTIWINGDMWKKLSKEDQQAFRNAGAEAQKFYLDALDKEVEGYRKTFQDAGVQFYQMPADDLKKWAAAMPDIPAEWAKRMEAKGLPGWQIMDRYLELSKKEGWEFPRKWGVR